MDACLIESCPLYEVVRCIHVGLLCIQNRPDDRPLMSSIIFMLENDVALLPAPKQPDFFTLMKHKAGETRENIGTSINTVSTTKLEGR